MIKIGGNVIDNDDAFKSFLADFAAIPYKKILVHGGGKIATEIGKKLGVTSTYVDGRRVTDAETIDLVTMVYGGLINKKAVALLQSFGCNAIGLTGADGNLLPAEKRPVSDVDFGWVGDPVTERIPLSMWTNLINEGLIPVMAPLTHDGFGNILNTNADTIAATIAKALVTEFDTSLIYCFEKKGILEDVENDNSYIRELSEATYLKLKNENRLFAGILPKLKNAFEAKAAAVSNVVIGHSSALQLLINKEAGTII